MTATLLLLGGFLGYHGFFWLFPSPPRVHFTPEGRAQEYIYARKPFEIVWVGSGLIGDFTKYLPEPSRSFNLFFPYSSSCLGIEIIARRRRTPRVIFVETNYLFKGSDAKLVDRLFHRIGYPVQYYLPGFQRKNNPLRWVKRLLHQVRPAPALSGQTPHFQEWLALHRKNYEHFHISEPFTRELERLKQRINGLTAQGCQILFFEMPIEESLKETDLYKLQKQYVRSLFPPESYEWIEQDSAYQYRTWDGIHLTQESVRTYVAYLSKQAQQRGLI
ncbi:hypothetical protein [Siphonobacter curvatus]|uniref:SGNH/GDSL hydrolase family protein n=1 Tax=Siphonobacter curvatus TaxID=2094562 RepID=A0A2S7IES1_9BACT|nr:hypothetical protein [Siphonobacter curvatus]PQA53175.1 hypothetical protein C5O19_24925 [Siphonobacter curvatus]